MAKLIDSIDAILVFQTIAEYTSLVHIEILFRLGVFNSAVNPAIYAIWYKHFRKSATELLSKKLIMSRK